MPRRGSADFVLSRYEGRISDTSLDMDSGLRTGSRSRQSRDLPVDGKKLLIRRPIKNNNTRSGAKRKTFYYYCTNLEQPETF